MGRFLLLVAALCLPAAAQAEIRAYSVRVPAGSRVEARVSNTADWDVSVSYDKETCLVSCEYRRKSGTWRLFLPPAIEIQTYTDGASNPTHFVIDPAGVHSPALDSRAAFRPLQSCVGNPQPVESLQSSSDPVPVSVPAIPEPIEPRSASASTPLPLRI